MQIQAFQPGEIRDRQNNIIRSGAYNKHTPLATADNMGLVDYMANNFEALKNALSGAYVYVETKDKFPAAGDGLKLYVDESDGRTYKWDGAQYTLLTAPINGKSAYELACDEGFTGTVKEWLSSIGAETIDDVSVDEAGYLTLHLHSGGTVTAPMKPIIESAAARDAAQAWAVSTQSPDNIADASSPTSKTQSSRTWALYSKSQASAASTSATNAKTSETNAKNSQTAAASSQSAAASSASAASTSASNAKVSETNAANSKAAASTSATNAATHETNAKTALAACQNIQTQVNAGLQTVTSAVKYRSVIASFSDLPTTGQLHGDMYNITSAGGTDINGVAIKAGDNVIWNKDKAGWDDVAGNVDLSDYPTNNDMAQAVMSVTADNDTITMIHKDATTTPVTINNVEHAKKASQDDNGQAIDIAAIKQLISKTVEDAVLDTKKAIFPVGSVYMSFTDSRNPADILGFGTWVALPAGRALVAQGSATAEDGSTMTFTAGNNYGEFKHQLTLGEMPSHKHEMPNWMWAVSNKSNTGDFNIPAGTNGNAIAYIYGAKSQSQYTTNTGAGSKHNNVSPGIAVYAWRRQA